MSLLGAALVPLGRRMHASVGVTRPALGPWTASAVRNCRRVMTDRGSTLGERLAGCGVVVSAVGLVLVAVRLLVTDLS